MDAFLSSNEEGTKNLSHASSMPTARLRNESGRAGGCSAHPSRAPSQLPGEKHPTPLRKSPYRRVGARLKNQNKPGSQDSKMTSGTTLQQHRETRTIICVAMAISSLITSQLVLSQLVPALPSMQAHKLMWLKDYLLSFLSRLHSLLWTPWGHTSFLGSSVSLVCCYVGILFRMLITCFTCYIHTPRLTPKSFPWSPNELPIS